MTSQSGLFTLLLFTVLEVKCATFKIDKTNETILLSSKKLYKHGVLVTYGDAEVNRYGIKPDIDYSNFLCLYNKQYFEVQTKKLYPPEFKFNLYISYDFGEYENKESIKQTDIFKGKNRVCFFYGYYVRESSKTQDKADFYINYLINIHGVKEINLLSFSIIITSSSVFSCFKTLDPAKLGFETVGKKKFQKNLIAHHTFPDNSTKTETEITLNGQTWALDGEGIFDMTFIDNRYNPENFDYDEYAGENPIYPGLPYITYENNKVDIVVDCTAKLTPSENKII